MGSSQEANAFPDASYSSALKALSLLVAQGCQHCRDAEHVFLHLKKVPVQSEVSGRHNSKKMQYYLCQTAVIAVSSLGLRIIFLQMITEFEVRKRSTTEGFAIIRSCRIIIYSVIPTQQ